MIEALITIWIASFVFCIIVWSIYTSFFWFTDKIWTLKFVKGIFIVCGIPFLNIYLVAKLMILFKSPDDCLTFLVKEDFVE